MGDEGDRSEREQGEALVLGETTFHLLIKVVRQSQERYNIEVEVRGGAK
jgi:hypothetical protein